MVATLPERLPFSDENIYDDSCGALCKTFTPEDVQEMQRAVQKELASLTLSVSPNGKANLACVSDTLLVARAKFGDEYVDTFLCLAEAAGHHH
eukprot:10116951-Karenia_brevis.AAC.1